ncbi:MAG TPA: choice-of-anchor L domain-containing protein [Saprospiraceae bacterium]|nr:choice-of-anchor L domain-containing protein [Saprospiraceae bacterium]HPI06248.1 choice-of-anchor L domain-containing protein [Saprospiraceae bacterium]
MNLKHYFSFRLLLAALIVTAFTVQAQAQSLQVTGANTAPFTPQNLISNIFLGEGVEVTNITYNGISSAVGYFTGGTTAIGIDRGIVLTTGVATTSGAALGSDEQGIDFASHDNASNATDASLAATATSGLNDVAVYSITFIPTSDTLRFKYCFASEEYPEFACSSFNDVFGFFISGPNPAGGNYNNLNIAKVPNTNLPVAINNVHPANPVYNCGPLNAQYYNNNNGSSVQPVYDGFTDVFTAQAIVTPCQQYTIKLAIADVSDGIYDSGVFLEAKSFGTGSLKVELATRSLDGTVTEGCTDGMLSFKLPTPTAQNFPIDYNVWGTATNGTDYQMIPPGLSIPAGQTGIDIPIIAFEDNTADGMEYIAVDVQRDPCNRDTIYIYLRDNGLIAPSLRADTSICSGAQPLDLNATLPIPLPLPPTFTNNTVYNISPTNTPVISPINVVGVQPVTLGTGVIRSVCLNAVHPWVDDLDIFLLSPGGQFLELTTDNGADGNNYTNTCFTPLETTVISSPGPFAPAAAAPFTDSWLPEGPWTDLWDGDNPTNGVWKLQVTDDSNGFTGSLQDWTITFEPSYKLDYLWTPSAGLSCVTCPIALASPAQTTTYSVIATDSYGCSVTDTVTLTVIPALPAPVVTCGASSSNSITFSWSDVPGADSYEVNVGGAGWIPASGLAEHLVNGLVPSSSVTIEVRGISAQFNCTANIGSATCVNCESPTSTLAVSGVNCFGQSQGAVVVTPDGANPPYNYSLGTLNNTTGNFQSLTAGNYVLVVTDNSNCSASANVTVPGPPQLTNTVAVQQQVSCFGGNNAVIASTAGGGTGTLTYQWSDPAAQSTAAAVSLTAGAYTVTVRDANGCTATASATVTQPTDLTATAIPSAATCFNVPSGSVGAIPAGGTLPYSFSWSNNILSQLNNGVLAGNYSVTVTDGNGCTETASAIVLEPAQLTTSTITTPTNCAGSSDGTAIATPSGGTGTYNYKWSDAAQQTTQTAIGLPAQIFTVTVTDANGCTAQQPASIASPTPLLVAADPTDASCNQSASGSAIATASGSNGGYNYLWNTVPAQSNPTAGNLTAGTYTVTVTDQKGCTATTTAIISEPAAILFTGTPQPASCFGTATGQIITQTQGGTSPYTYNWSAGQSGANLVNRPAGDYTATVTDANGCTQTLQSTIDQPTEIILAAVPQHVLCKGENNGAVELTAEGGTPNYNISWNGPAGFSGTGATLGNLFAGTYTAIVTDASGCSETNNVVVNEPATQLALALPPVADTICYLASDGSATVQASGGTPPYNYFWNVNGGTSATISGLASAEYIVTVTDVNNCQQLAQTFIFQKGELFGYAEARNPSCNAGDDGIGIVTGVFYSADSANVNSFNYTWNTVPPQNTRIATGLKATLTYTVTITDVQGCTDEQNITVGNPEMLEAHVTAHEDVKCFAESTGWAAANGSGGQAPYTFFWNTGGAGQTDSLAENLSAGIYRVTVTDANNCPATTSVSILEPAALTLEMLPTHVKCFGESTGMAVARPSGGVTPYQYLWQNGQTTSSANDIPAGVISVLITDGNGCTLPDSIQILQPPTKVGGISEEKDPKCHGGKDGEIDIIASGGTPPYMYALDNAAWNGSPKQIGIGAGTYVPRVVDQNGCVAVLPAIQVFERSAVQVDLGPDFSIVLGQDTQLLALVTNALGTVRYQWSAEDSTWLSCLDCSNPSVYSLFYENYFDITVIDSLGCPAQDRVRITVEKPRRIFVPTGFSPNGDSSNDRLLVHGQQSAHVRDFRLYDRWGELVFETGDFTPNDPEKGWDGNFRGSPMDPGVYVWVLEVEYMDGITEVLHGNTTLIR